MTTHRLTIHCLNMHRQTRLAANNGCGLALKRLEHRISVPLRSLQKTVCPTLGSCQDYPMTGLGETTRQSYSAR